MNYKGRITFPSIEGMRSKSIERSQLRFVYSFSTPSGEAQIEAVTKDRSKSLEGLVNVQVSGENRKSLDTSSGDYRNVVGLNELIRNFKILNAVNPRTANELDSSLLKGAQAQSTTIWYAPGHGAVSEWTHKTSGVTIKEDAHCA